MRTGSIDGRWLDNDDTDFNGSEAELQLHLALKGAL